MIFLAVSDVGIATQPIVATDVASAIDQLRQMYGTGTRGDGTGVVRVALALPAANVTIVPNVDPSKATVQFSGDGATQKTLRDNVATAIANNTAYLTVPGPTNAQVIAQVRALTQQVDALIRLAVGDFTATT